MTYEKYIKNIVYFLLHFLLHQEFVYFTGSLVAFSRKISLHASETGIVFTWNRLCFANTKLF